jgi:predicted ATPase
MELVYLWVEDYKNIKKQGFNFSPKFHCEYDGETLTIDENDDYIPNFFGENINVTAIVGKNGSGKSSLFESIIYNITSKTSKHESKMFTIFFDKHNSEHYYKKLGDIAINNIKVKELKDISNFSFTFYFNYTLDTLANSEFNSSGFYYNSNSKGDNEILLFPNKSYGNISISDINYLSQKNFLNYAIKYNHEFDFIKGFFVPTFYEIKSLDMEIEKGMLEIKSRRPLASKKEHDIEQASKYILNQINYNNKCIKNNNLEEMLLNFHKNDNYIKYLDLLQKSRYDDLFYDTADCHLLKVRDAFQFLKFVQKQNDNEYKGIITERNEIKKNRELLQNLPPYVDIEFFDKNGVSFNSLSYGQKFIIRFIYDLLNQIETIRSDDKVYNINLLLDEIEQGLHPEWQRKFIKLLIDILKKKQEFNFNIICATHSPFILSDLPKENIYFLKDGKKDDGIKKQTFGANIHTLLSDSFFMEDGLMGEFAKSKIDKVIKILNQEKPSKEDLEYCEKIIPVIGEPIVKNQLQKMLDSKKLPKVGEIAKIHKEIKELQSRLKDLEGKDDKK